MSALHTSLSLTPPADMNRAQRWGFGLISLGILLLIMAWAGASHTPVLPMLLGGFFLVAAGFLWSRGQQKYRPWISAFLVLGILSFALLWWSPEGELPFAVRSLALIVMLLGLAGGGIIFSYYSFGRGLAGIKNNGLFQSTITRPNGAIAWVLGIVFTGYYILLYWFPEYLHGLIALIDPFFVAVFGRSGLPANNGGHYNQWLLYGFFYTVAVVVMGIRFMFKYRHNRYQLLRTGSVMFFQLIFAFLLPNILAALNHQELYFHYFWPLDYDVLFPGSITHLTQSGEWTRFFFWWSLILSVPGVIALTYFFGKRWYCSWVCGCGGLAETAGDPFRHLSDKSLKAWQIERFLIHGVLVLIATITLLLLVNWNWTILPQTVSDGLQKGYGFLIGSVFAGVVGVGFYPLLGSRVWCRFGCPQAAILGLLQKYFSRFRITTNGGQCISCGNCSTYCEMGIDVKWYAQREQNIVRASCVGCGVCSAVCPRGVLKLENGPIQHKTVIHIDRDEVKLLEPDQ